MPKYISKGDIKMSNRHMKWCSKSLITMEMQTKTTIRYQPTPVRMAIIRKHTNNESAEEEEKSTLVHCWWESKLAQPLLKKWKTQPPYNSTIPLLGIYWKEMKTEIQWDTCTSAFMAQDFPGDSAVKTEKAMAPHSSTHAWKIPWTEGPGGLQSMGSLKSQIQLSDFTLFFHFHALEKEMATHSSVLAWRIPGTGEPGGLPPMGSHRVGHDWSDLAAAAAAAAVKNPCANAGDLGSNPGLERSPGGGNSNPLQYSCLGNPMNREALQAIARVVVKCWIWLSD